MDLTSVRNTLLWIDILGFSNKVENQSLSDTITSYDSIINNYLERYSGVEFDIISDTLIFWPRSPQNKHQEISNIVQAAHLYSNTSLMYVSNANPLIRGAIVFDEFIIDQRDHERRYQVNIRGVGQENRVDKMSYHRIIGKAIVKAHRWETTQNWCLISIDPAYNDFIENNTAFPKYLLEQNYLIKYPIPTKNGIFDGYVVNPFLKEYCVGKEKVSPGINDLGTMPMADGYVEVGKAYEICLQTHLKENETSKPVTMKIENTIKFYNYVCDNERFITGYLSP